MKLKRLSALLLAAALTMSMAACGDSDEDSKESKKDNASSSSSSASQQESTADASSSEETTTTTAEEAEPAPLISVKEYLTSGVWVFTDDTIADLTQAIEKRGFDMSYCFTYRYYNLTNYYPTDSDKDKDYVSSPLCLIGKDLNNSDLYGGSYSVDAVDGQAFQEEMEYSIELRSECFSADGTLKGNTITFDDYEITNSDFTEDISLTKPITLVRKEVIPYEERVKNLVGNWKIVNDEKLLKGVNAAYSDDNTYKYCMENFVGKTITISEDGKFSGTVTELPEFNKSDEVSFYDPDNANPMDLAMIGAACPIYYLYRENDDVLSIDYNYRYSFVLEKID